MEALEAEKNHIDNRACVVERKLRQLLETGRVLHGCQWMNNNWNMGLQINIMSGKTVNGQPLYLPYLSHPWHQSMFLRGSRSRPLLHQFPRLSWRRTLQCMFPSGSRWRTLLHLFLRGFWRGSCLMSGWLLGHSLSNLSFRPSPWFPEGSMPTKWQFQNCKFF